jgi:hypothetical protein
MIYLAAGSLAVLLVVSLSFASVIHWLVRQQARERDLLINQVCSLAGKPWQPPPARERVVHDPGPVLFQSPEQMTEDDLEPSVY